MHTDFNFIPPAAFVGLLGAIFGSIFTVAVIALAALVRQRQVARLMALVWGAGAGVYVVLLLGCSLASHERDLARGQEKYFCEVDCHTAYSIADVKTTATLGTQRAAGTFHVIALRTRFDENTISARRPREVPLTPNRRALALVTADGRRFEPVEIPAPALQAFMATPSTPLTQALKPGEAYRTLVAFDLPADARTPRLLLTSGEWETRFLVGQENSFFHRKTYLEL